MQNACVDMPEHAVRQVLALQYRAEFHDVVGQIFWWNRRVFDKRDGALFTCDVTEQAHCLLAHSPHALELRITEGNGVTKALSGLAADRLHLVGPRPDRTPPLTASSLSVSALTVRRSSSSSSAMNSTRLIPAMVFPS